MIPRRYQLRKDAVSIVERGHPWVFREQMSTAATVFADGQWLRLVDGGNRVVGHGIYEAEGAIAIRMLRTGAAAPDAAWLREALRTAISKRSELAATTDGIRLVHGESDGIPAVVVDRFGDTLVVASYSAGADGLARYVARALGAETSGIVGPARHVMLRPARRRRGPALPPRTLRGSPSEVVQFTEDTLRFAVDLTGGHKTGTYLDLRGLRRALAAPLVTPGARVLNLFSYTGMLARVAEAAGATDITSVDQSDRALAFAAAHHVADPARHHFVADDVFKWLPALGKDEQFDLVIVDPPSMTSRVTQVPSVLAGYRKLYRAALEHVKPGGALVAACCTSRVEREVFKKTVSETLGARFKLERDIPAEADHPVPATFPQADYLKVLVWRAKS